MCMAWCYGMGRLGDPRVSTYVGIGISSAFLCYFFLFETFVVWARIGFRLVLSLRIAVSCMVFLVGLLGYFPETLIPLSCQAEDCFI